MSEPKLTFINPLAARTDMPMANVFLSYSRKDKDFMLYLHEYLLENGLTVWTDAELVPGTPAWEKAIEEAIKEAQSLIVILSPDSKDSTWVGREVAMAEDMYKIPIFPVLLRGDEQASVPPRLVNHQRVDLRQDPKAGLQALVTALQKQLNQNNKPLSAPKAAPGITLVVAKFGPADYRTINEAVENAPDNATILVRPGIYNEGIVLNKPLEIVGDGSVGTIVIETSDKNCFSVEADYGLVRGLTIQQKADLKEDEEVEGFFAVEITKGRVVFEKCNISSTSRSCVMVSGLSANPIIRDCKIHGSKRSGVGLSDKSQCLVEGCEIYGNESAGISIATSSKPQVRDCRIWANQGYGLSIIDNGEGLIENCDIFENGESGILVKGKSNPTVRRCKIHDCKESGVFVTEEGLGLFEDDDIYKNGLAGISISENSNPTIRHCKIYDGKSYGMTFAEDSTGVVEDCEVYGNILEGIDIDSGSNPTVRNCKIYDGKGGGISINNKGLGIIEGCDIYGNAFAGVFILKEGKPVIKQCKIHHGKQGGIYLYENGLGQIEDCSIYENSLSGIEIKDKSNPIIKNCKIYDGKQDGVYVHTNGQGNFEQCDIYGNVKNGVEIQTNGNPTISHCKIYSNRDDGV